MDGEWAASEDGVAALSAHPLPDGVADVLVNKSQLAHAMTVSLPTIDAWLRSGLPVAEGGTNGRPYQFQLSHCVAWWEARKAREAQAKLDSDKAAEAYRLHLSGGKMGDDAPQSMTLAEQKTFYEVQARWLTQARARRDLMESEDVAIAFEGVFAACRDGLDSLPDRLARECGLDGAATEAAVVICDDTLRAMVRVVEEAFGDAATFAFSGLPDRPSAS